MTATVFVTLEVQKTIVVPDVRSLEEAEEVALAQLAEEHEYDEGDIISIDSFEGGEGMSN